MSPVEALSHFPVLQASSLFQVSLKRNRPHQKTVRSGRIVPRQLNLRQVIQRQFQLRRISRINHLVQAECCGSQVTLVQLAQPGVESRLALLLVLRRNLCQINQGGLAVAVCICRHALAEVRFHAGSAKVWRDKRRQ